MVNLKVNETVFLNNDNTVTMYGTCCLPHLSVVYFNVVTDWSKVYTTSVCIHRLSWFNLPTGWKRFSFLCCGESIFNVSLSVSGSQGCTAYDVVINQDFFQKCQVCSCACGCFPFAIKKEFFILYSFDSSLHWPSLTFLIYKLCIKSVVWFLSCRRIPYSSSLLSSCL